MDGRGGENLHKCMQLVAVLVVTAALVMACGGTGDTTESVDATPATSSTAAPTSTTASDADDATAASGVPVFHAEENPDVLSAWGQLELLDGSLTLAADVTAYTLQSKLFSDNAQKLRTVWLPEGSDPAAYDPTEVFAFPVGTVITKTFYYPVDADGAVLKVAEWNDAATPIDLSSVRLIETRILVHRADGWDALPYVWNEEQTEATLARTGDLQLLTLVDDDTGEQLAIDFPYVVPNVNQCAGCHATNHTTKEILPIGPKTRHLNLDVDLGSGPTAQLTLWEDRGIVGQLPEFSTLPSAVAWDDPSASLDDRARAYLDINCAHCHNTNGPADTSGLFLEPTTDLGPRLGVCKPPIAAGTGTGNRSVGISPGEPDDSIFVFRMQTDDPGAMMPELGRGVVHDEGVELISEWIASLDGDCA